ncbi:MAG: Uma2 family endonuclease [Gemmatimonadaceae bacterium]
MGLLVEVEAILDSTNTMFTAAELLASPLAGKHLELVAGVIHRLTPADAVHGRIVFNVMMLLGRHVSDKALGALFTEQTGFVLKRNPDTLRCPDVAFVAARHLPPGGLRHGWMETVPDLVVEIRSPSDRSSALSAKVREYLDVGVRSVWVIDSDARTVAIHAADAPVVERRDGETLDAGEVVQEFRCQVAAIFEGVARE